MLLRKRCLASGQGRGGQVEKRYLPTLDHLPSYLLRYLAAIMA